eukprot:351773-Chlamydomonas_euryale.AAC.25
MPFKVVNSQGAQNYRRTAGKAHNSYGGEQSRRTTAEAHWPRNTNSSRKTATTLRFTWANVSCARSAISRNANESTRARYPARCTPGISNAKHSCRCAMQPGACRDTRQPAHQQHANTILW